MRYFYEGIKIFVFIYRIKYKVDNGLKKILQRLKEYKGYNTINLLMATKKTTIVFSINIYSFSFLYSIRIYSIFLF